MSEKKRPFDAAINFLKWDEGWAEDAKESCHDAIRVLEAAGKMDKKRLADGLEELWGVYMDERGAYGDMKKIVGDLDALLEALLERGKEKI